MLLPSSLRVLTRSPKLVFEKTQNESQPSPAVSDSTECEIIDDDDTKTKPQQAEDLILQNLTITVSKLKRRSTRLKMPVLSMQDLNKFLRRSADSKVSFGLYRMMIGLTTDIAILLTFGTIFPPLAVIGCAAFWLKTIYIQLVIGRLVYLSQDQPYLINVCKELNEECVGISKMFINCLLSLPLLLTIAWSFFLFDILGAVAGYRTAVLIFLALPNIAVIILPVLIKYKEGKLSWRTKTALPTAPDILVESQNKMIELATIQRNEAILSTSDNPIRSIM
jgi:hypothetical protein